MDTEGYLKADFHSHTDDDPEDIVNYSSKTLIDTMAKKGIEVLSITNHDTVTFNNDLKRYAEDKGILLIPGVEATIKGKHVIIINIDKYYAGMFKSLSDLKTIKGNGSLIIAPHPFFPNSHCLKSDLLKYIEYFDAIEYSHFYIDKINLNNKAVTISKRENLPLIGTSDAHFLWQINKTYSCIKASKGIMSIITAIRNRMVKIVTNPLTYQEFFGYPFRILLHSISPKKTKELNL